MMRNGKAGGEGEGGDGGAIVFVPKNGAGSALRDESISPASKVLAMWEVYFGVGWGLGCEIVSRV